MEKCWCVECIVPGLSLEVLTEESDVLGKKSFGFAMGGLGDARVVLHPFCEVWAQGDSDGFPVIHDIFNGVWFVWVGNECLPFDHVYHEWFTSLGLCHTFLKIELVVVFLSIIHFLGKSV